jgi:excinuclease ABC subunit B
MVVMYADEVTDSMKRAISETQRRRQIQLAYNEEHGIDPTTVRKKVSDILLSLESDRLSSGSARPERRRARRERTDHSVMGRDDMERLVKALEDEMHDAARDLRFEYAARLRDEVKDLRRELDAMERVGLR